MESPMEPPLCPYRVPTDSLWSLYGVPMDSHLSPHCSPIESYRLPVKSLWIPLWSPHCILMGSPIESPLCSYGVPYGAPIVPL
mgnify:CR=1 FL=1